MTQHPGFLTVWYISGKFAHINIIIWKCFGEPVLVFASLQYLFSLPSKRALIIWARKIIRRPCSPCIPVKKPGKTAQASLCAGHTWNVSRSPGAMRPERVQGWVGLTVRFVAFFFYCVYLSHNVGGWVSCVCLTCHHLVTSANLMSIN